MFRKGTILFCILVALLCLTAIPVVAQGGTVWQGDYFNNCCLSFPSAFSRQDSAVAFDWGAGSPGSGVSADNFSARWGTDPFFQAGTYRFWAQADDNVRVFVDFNSSPIIDTFGQSRVGQVVSSDIFLTQGTHHVQVDYQEMGGNAYVYVTWANVATNPTGPNFPVPGGSVPPPTNGPWTAQYFANPSLVGTPSLIQTEVTPTHDWGSGSPTASIPADNFSARWTSLQTLNAGTYQLTVRADDGVRVIIDGVTYVNEWHTATGATYTIAVNLFAGQHTFIVDFYEAGGLAFLNYTFVPANIIPTPIPTFPTGATATVTNAYRLNVRSAPSAVTGIVLTKINRNETYAIVGRNGNTSWWQINVNGIIGWVNARYVTANNAQNVPVTSGTTSPTPIPNIPTGASATVTNASRLNVRNAPNAVTGSILIEIRRNDTYPIVGRNSDASWWQINVNGIIGWVNARYVTANNAQNVPVTSGTTTPTPIPATCSFAPAPRLSIGRLGRVTPGLPNNLRALPTSTSVLLGQIPTGGIFTVLNGPQCAEGLYWWQVNYNGLTGWTPEGGSGQYWLEPL
jgi:uncharacterized protein YgiM (DUF1202 family)